MAIHTRLSRAYLALTRLSCTPCWNWREDLCQFLAEPL